MEDNITNNTIKLSTEDLQKIKKIGEDYKNTVIQFGELHLERLDVERAIEILNERQTQLETTIRDLKKAEQDAINFILDKYGEGSLNIKNGTFTKNV